MDSLEPEDDVLLTQLDRITLPEGDVLHGIKNGDPGFSDLGEVYFSFVLPGAVKGWKRHKSAVLNLLVPLGEVRFVFFSSNSNQLTTEIVGVSRYVRVTIPSGIWFGFQGLSDSASLIVSLASEAHNPLEVERMELEAIEFDWTRR